MEKLLNLDIFNVDEIIGYHTKGEVMVRVVFNLVMVVTISLALYFI